MEVIPSLPLAAALALPFLTTFVALYLILFKPMLAYLAERDAATEGARHEAAHLDEEAKTKLDDLQTRLQKVRDEIAAFRGESRQRVSAATSAILGEARGKADERMKSALKQLDADRANASSSLRTHTREISRDIAAQVLGRDIQA
jgi:F-type H+-transporting ATPase subunit b